MKTRLNTLFCLFALLLPLTTFADHTQFGNPIDGVFATPTSYIVTMRKMEFSKDGGQTWYTFAEGGGDFDIASVAPGQSVGAFGSGQVLPAGTYTKMRATISRFFKITASTTDAGNGQPARTDTTNPNNATLVNGNGDTFTSLGVALTDGGTATLQTVPVPIEAEFPEEEGMSVELIGTTDLRFTEDLDPFTIPVGKTTPPTMRLDFDVSSAVAFKTTGVGTAVMMVLGPHVTMTIIP